ncbi:MAG: hypothetical protein AB7E79_09770 [Rhodospirillaceae bacterium]
MTEVLIFWALAVIVIAGVALALPCQGCRLRRERLRRAYDDWKKSRARS